MQRTSTKPRRSLRITVAAAAAAVSFTGIPSAFAGGTIDGTLTPSEYTFTLGVQDTPTGFGDNLSELNAAFADVLSDGSVRLMLTGNLETNGNGLVIFFDTRNGGAVANMLPGGFGEFGSMGGAKTDDWGTDNDGSTAVNPTPGGPSVVSPGFNPELSFELNAGGGTGDYYINLIDMRVANEPLPNRDVFLGQNLMGAAAVTQTYFREPLFNDAGTVTHAFDNSNTQGVLAFNFDVPPGELGDPLSATTGFEASFSTQFMNQDPLQEIKILPFITNGGGDFLSNQFLPGLEGQTNLGGPGDPGGTPLFDVRTTADANNFYLVIPLPTWTAGSGTWATSASWNTGNAPSGVNTSAVFAGAGGTVTVTDPITVGGIGFRTANGYTVDGATITLDTLPYFDLSPRAARLEATEGTHTIAAPMVWNQDVIVNAAAGGNLTITGAVSGTDARSLTKLGAGTFAMERLRFATLNIEGGTVRVTPGTLAGTTAKASKIGSLAIAGGPAAPTGALDVTNNILIVSNPSTEDVRAYLLAGHDGGTWSGDGIVSSLADSTNYGLGYATAAQLNAGGTYAGLPVVDSDTIVRYTRYGDANLDSLVNLNDFNALAANFGQGGRQWFQGDFNYDGLVNLSDFNRLAANFGLSASGPAVTPQDWSNLAAAVPEPAAMGLIAVAGPVLLRRRRRD